MSNDQRTALITGASRGIGRAVAAELHRRGLRVVVTARNAADARTVAAELGPDAFPHALDVTDPDSIERSSRAAGQVDVLVCNTGVLLDDGTDPLSVPIELVEETMRVNLCGSWRVAQTFIPPMVERGWGRVVLISSGTTAEFGGELFARAPGYSLSKSAINELTTMLATQVAGSGVLVNAVNPGRVRTRRRPGQPTPPENAARFIADVATLPSDGPTGQVLTEHCG